MTEFTKQDYILLAEALDRASTRQMSESRISPHAETAKYHRDKAIAMRKLKSKVLELGAEDRISGAFQILEKGKDQ